MTIYLVLDEENTPIGEFSNFEKAVQSAEKMTFLEEDHYYHIEPIELENA